MPRQRVSTGPPATPSRLYVPRDRCGIPGFRNSLHCLDPEDAVTLRACVIRFRYLTGKETWMLTMFSQRCAGWLTVLLA
jgi:hypothetical protein